ncbi:MAG: hypothetical protein QM602_09065, partial [Microbacterium sp.]
ETDDDTATDEAIRIGATAQATLSLAAAEDVLTVPTSAVTVSGTQATVLVLTDGTTVATPVEIGAIGAERIQITSGLEEGDRVVLADLTQEIGTDDDDDTSASLSDLGDSGGPSGSTGGQFPGGGQMGGPG